MTTVATLSTANISTQAKVANQLAKGVSTAPLTQTKVMQKAVNSSFGAKAFDYSTDKVAKGMGWLLGKKPMQSLSRFIAKSKFGVSHVCAAGAVVLSGFYMKETLKSKKIEPEQKPALVLNQGLVGLFSLVSAYTLDGALNKKTKQFTDTFLKANAKLIGNDPKNIARYERGLSAAKSLAVFGLVYRFIAPVFVTPIANKLSESMKKDKA